MSSISIENLTDEELTKDLFDALTSTVIKAGVKDFDVTITKEDGSSVTAGLWCGLMFQLGKPAGKQQVKKRRRG